MKLKYLWPWLKAEFGWRVLGKRYGVCLTEKAQQRLDEQLDELPEETQAVIRAAIERINRNPYSGDRMELEDEDEDEDVEES